MDQMRQKVLIVDDNPLNLQLLGKLLTEQGYQALIASSVEQALAIAEAKNPGLILTDIMMPDIDGRQFCLLLKQKPQSKNIPVVFVSATTDSEIISEALEAGGVDFLSKPYSLIELLHIVHKHLPVYRPDGFLQSELIQMEQVGMAETGGLKDTSLLDSLTQSNRALRDNVIHDFHAICRKVEFRLEAIVRHAVPVDTVLQDLHRLANLSPYLTNKFVIEEIKKFEKTIRATMKLSNEDAANFVSMLCCLERELKAG